MRVRPDEEGFTLIEALVALVLGVAVVLSTLCIAAGEVGHALALRDALGGPQFRGRAQGTTPAIFSGQDGCLVLLHLYFPPAGDCSDLVRGEALLVASGDPGPFGAGQVSWHVPDARELRYLDTKGSWLRDWSMRAMPRVYAFTALTSPQTVELVASFPVLIEPEYAAGSHQACSLAADVLS